MGRSVGSWVEARPGVLVGEGRVALVLISGILHPQAHAFYGRLIERGYAPNEHIDVLPAYQVIYVCVPKCASSCIKTTLSALVGRNLQTPEEAHERRLSGLRAPKHVSLATLWHLATSPSALRFAFVRNPYARLVSCWASKFRPTGEDLRALTTNLAITFFTPSARA